MQELHGHHTCSSISFGRAAVTTACAWGSAAYVRYTIRCNVTARESCALLFITRIQMNAGNITGHHSKPLWEPVHSNGVTDRPQAIICYCFNTEPPASKLRCHVCPTIRETHILKTTLPALSCPLGLIASLYNPYTGRRDNIMRV